MLDRSPTTYYPKAVEYRTVNLPTQATDRELNRWGSEGWECFAIHLAGDGTWNHSLKRPADTGPRIERRVRS
jgi:hypothetical protein